QHIDFDLGAALWNTDGNSMCIELGDQKLPSACSDGAGGAVVAWQDARPTAAGFDIYAQRVEPSVGAFQWAPGGVAVCSATGDQVATAIAADPMGGSVVSWIDSRTAPNGTDVYAAELSDVPSGGLLLERGGRARLGRRLGPRDVRHGLVRTPALSDLLRPADGRVVLDLAGRLHRRGQQRQHHPARHLRRARVRRPGPRWSELGGGRPEVSDDRWLGRVGLERGGADRADLQVPHQCNLARRV